MLNAKVIELNSKNEKLYSLPYFNPNAAPEEVELYLSNFT